MIKKSMGKLLAICLATVTLLTGCSTRPTGNNNWVNLDNGSGSVQESVLEEPQPTPEPTPIPTPEPTPVPEAHQMSVPVEKNGNDVSGNLSDNEMWSFQSIKEDDRFEVGSLDGEPIYSLYIIWNKRPLPFDIVYTDGSVQEVAGNMLHQTVHLDKPSSLVSISVSYAGTTLEINELSAYSEGTLPEGIQDWQIMGEGEADICLFPTHADDEYVFFGGILPYYAGELGCKVQVCWMCCHDNNYVRNHELLNALWESGCHYYPEINYNALDYACGSYDEAVRRYSFEQFERFQVEMIRKYRPLVVVGHDEKGEYGHGAHILASVTLEQAVADAAEPTKFRDSAMQYGAWEVKKTYIHLYGEDPTILDYDTRLKAFGGKTAYEVALLCYEEHKTQFENSEFTVYRDPSPFDSARFGLQRTTVGPDLEKNDLLENIDLEQEKAGIEYVSSQAAENAKNITDQLLNVDLFLPCEQQGTLEARHYSATDVATSVTLDKQMLVYLPYGYDPEQQYNVLILTQGAGGDERYWFTETKDEAGRQVSLKNLLDNMIAEGICEPLIVVSTNWFNTASCDMVKFDMNDLTIASRQQASEMRRNILPFIIQNYSTYAAGTTPPDIIAARDHFGYAGLSWGSMTCVLGMMREDVDCFSWFGSFAPGLFDLYDTVQRIDAASETSPIHYFLMCCGTDDGELPKSAAIYDRVTSASSLIEGENCKFIEVQNGTHWYGTWMTGIYNSLLVFFK